MLQLSAYAEEWAKKLAREDTFEHRTNQELGENLYCSWSSNPKAKCPGDKPVDVTRKMSQPKSLSCDFGM